jgi:hypothetical protein
MTDTGFVETLQKLRRSKGGTAQDRSHLAMKDPRVMQAIIALGNEQTGGGARLTVDESEIRHAERVGDMPRRDPVQLANIQRAHEHKTPAEAKAAGNEAFAEKRYDDALACYMRSLELERHGGADEAVRATLQSNIAAALLKLDRPTEVPAATRHPPLRLPRRRCPRLPRDQCSRLRRRRRAGAVRHRAGAHHPRRGDQGGAGRQRRAGQGALPSGARARGDRPQGGRRRRSGAGGAAPAGGRTLAQAGARTPAATPAPPRGDGRVRPLSHPRAGAQAIASMAAPSNFMRAELARLQKKVAAAKAEAEEAAAQKTREKSAEVARGLGTKVDAAPAAEGAVVPSCRTVAKGYVAEVDFGFWARTWMTEQVHGLKHANDGCVVRVTGLNVEKCELHASVKQKRGKRSLFYDLTVFLDWEATSCRGRSREDPGAMKGIFYMYNVGNDTKYCPGGDKETSYMYELGFPPDHFGATAPWAEQIKVEAAELYDKMGEDVLPRFVRALTKKAEEAALSG